MVGTRFFLRRPERSSRNYYLTCHSTARAVALFVGKENPCESCRDVFFNWCQDESSTLTVNVLVRTSKSNTHKIIVMELLLLLSRSPLPLRTFLLLQNALCIKIHRLRRKWDTFSMPPNDMSFQPFQKKTSSKFPPPKKTAKTCVSQLTFRSLFQPKKHQFFSQKTSRPWCLREVSCWKPSKRWMMRPWNPKRRGAVNIWIWKKKRRWFFFRRWIQNRCNYRTSEWSFTRGFGDLLLTAPQNGGNDEYVSNGLKKWSEGFFFSWGSDGMRTNVYMSTFQVLHMPPGSLHHKHNMFSFCSGHHLIGEHNSAYLTHITLLSPHIVHPRGLPEPLKTCGSKSTFLLGR